VSEDSTKTAPAEIPKKEKSEGGNEETQMPASYMTAEEATALIIAPYVTEKTFNQIEKENKLAFIVAERASKKDIKEAVQILYESEATEINTTRTIRGKKAFVMFKAPEGARELATKLGLV
jgi:large subunit ribosomal protein L23